LKIPAGICRTYGTYGTSDDGALDLSSQGNHTVGQGGKFHFIDGDASHRVHSGVEGGDTNEGPVLDLALLSEPPVRRYRT